MPELPPWYAEAATLDETLSKVQLDPASWARHRLNADSRAAFDRDGYLIINDVLPPDAFQAAVQALDDLKALRHTQGLPPTSSVLDPVYSNSHSLWEEPAVVRMLSTPKLLPKVVDIMGWNVYLYHGHLTVNPPFSDGPATPSDADQKTLGFHQDSGRVNQELEVPDGAPVPRLSVKAAFYLSDLSERGRGQTWVIPGTHKIAAYGPRPQPRGGDGPDANQVSTFELSFEKCRDNGEFPLKTDDFLLNSPSVSGSPPVLSPCLSPPTRVCSSTGGCFMPPLPTGRLMSGR